MANKEHEQILRQGVGVWNAWRSQSPDIQPDLSGVELKGARLRRINLSGTILSGAKLQRAVLSKANLTGADLSGAYLRAAYFRQADLSGANLQHANLKYAMMVATNLDQSDISHCHVYGVAAWDVVGTPRCQTNLIITRKAENPITVDNLKLAQFIYLLLNYQELREVVNSVTERGVLLLGRFGGGGLDVLRAIADKLREWRYLPIIFDFDRPQGRNYTETVKTLVGLSRFVIVDLSGPSVPQELYATVPFFKIPFVPILAEGLPPYALSVDILEYDWVVKPIVRFASITELLERFPVQIIQPAEERYQRRQKLLDELFHR